MAALSEAVPVPAHVPPEAVYDFDMRADPGLLANPHERVREMLREAPPVFWTPRNGGRWIAIGHPEIFQASRDPENFSSGLMPREMLAAAMAMMPKDMPRIPQATPITMDPPEHGKFRGPLQKTFSPRAAMNQIEEIRGLCDELIDKVIDQGHCDFIAAIAEPLPVTVFLKMMGLPVSRLAEFRELVHEFLANTASGDMMASAAMSRKVADAMLADILARKDDRRDDIISLLWATEIDGEPMTLELMEDYAVLLFIAGLDTVINGMGFGVRHLATHPELQEKLRAEPELIVEAAEELLRRYSFTIPMRRVAQDTTLGGFDLKQGEWLALYIPGADLDPREFAEPERFDLDRENKVHIAFGAGPHRCLGAHLARVELQVLYQQLLTRLPPFRLDPDASAAFHSGNIIAFDSLPIRWD
ncbi:cytochrome P450 [Novosphingobium sp. JCM 18896]|uniref:cytochrome P450 n=1 Tax=Novosphingobium sp. JCM 18896 TaxID=2989731 RepID=UPI0022216041|nr:cytochrome P450 [Novosphingobium sp. JCM 18896]MCW1427626.1 cytochrome P450 [Novosphingobium sp. JCM 18896]